MKRCLCCNSPMSFDSENLVYVCDYCGRTYTLDEVVFELSDCYLEEEGEE